MKVDAKKGSSIAALDERHHARMILFSGPNGPAGMGFMSAGGELLLQIGVNPDDSAELVMRDNKQKVLFRAP
jgi:hypothetical protein